MGTLGTLGGIIFSVSNSKINTFDAMKWDSSARYATHDRHLKDILLEFVGEGADTISFSMYFSVFDGVNPITEIEKLLKAERSGEVMRLIIGGKPYGKSKWVIDKLSKDLQHWDGKGNLLIASVNVSLIAYAGR